MASYQPLQQRRRSSLAVAAGAAALFLVGVLGSLLWHDGGRSAGGGKDPSTVLQGDAPVSHVEEHPNAFNAPPANAVPAPLITSNLALEAYPGQLRKALAPCVVFGPGVEGPLVVGERTHIIVALRSVHAADDPEAERVNEAARQAWEAAEFGYATFENEEGDFSALSQPLNGSEARSFRIAFTPPRPGTFKLTVDLLSHSGVYPVHDRRMETVLVSEASEAPVATSKPERCEGLPDADAHWFKCATAPGLPKPEECLRWGVTFRPNKGGGCYYESWTPRDLMAYANATSGAKKHWILIMGTSRIRGVFLSAADHLLNGQRGEFGGISKCWGRMEVEMGNLRLTYQDTRVLDTVKWPIPEQHKELQCHNDKVASYDDLELYANSTQFLANIMAPAADGGEVPTALVFEYLDEQKPSMYRDLFYQHLPPAWRGSTTAIFFRSLVTGHVESPPLSEVRRARWTEKATAGNASVPLEIIDTLEIIRPWMRVSEFGVRRASQHWHSCTTKARRGGALHLADDGAVPFAVQGLVTDQLAQMVFNKVLGPRPPRSTEMTEPASPKLERPAYQVCLDCPASLLPFHIKPQAQPTCYKRLPPPHVEAQYVPALTECPAWCMEGKPHKVMDTKSGKVEVRNCMEPGKNETQQEWGKSQGE